MRAFLESKKQLIIEDVSYKIKLRDWQGNTCYIHSPLSTFTVDIDKDSEKDLQLFNFNDIKYCEFGNE